MPACQSTWLHRRPTIFTMEAASRGGDAEPENLRDVSPPVGFSGKASVGALGGRCPQKLKQNVKLVYNY